MDNRTLLEVIETLTIQLQKACYLESAIDTKESIIENLNKQINDLRDELQRKEETNSRLTIEINQLKDGNLSGDLFEKMLQDVRKNGRAKINAIKDVRARANWGLKAAKDFVEFVNKADDYMPDDMPDDYHP